MDIIASDFGKLQVEMSVGFKPYEANWQTKQWSKTRQKIQNQNDQPSVKIGKPKENNEKSQNWKASHIMLGTGASKHVLRR